MATIYTRATTLLALIARASAHGAGAWKDPNHYVSDSSLAGLRFISEKPAHTLNVVGTDDGTTWWSIKGSCSGKGMTQLKFDFSPKGGPSDASATWAKSADGVETATFSDGNVWTLLPQPTAAFAASDGLDDHAGPFVDPNHHAGPSSWQGFRSGD